MGCDDIVSVAPAPSPDHCAITSPHDRFAVTLIRSQTDSSPGNTVPAIQDAWSQGWQHIEVDVVLDGSGELIPGRYDDLGSYTSCTGRASQMTTMELSECEYREASGVPVLPIWHGLDDTDFVGIYLDLKYTRPEFGWDVGRSVAAVERLYERLGRPEGLVAMSYDPRVTEALVEAGIRAAYKGYPSLEETMAFVEDAAAQGAEMVCVPAGSLDTAIIERSHELGLWLLPWEYETATDADFIIDLLDAGVGGLITGLPSFVQTVADMRCPEPGPSF